MTNKTCFGLVGCLALLATLPALAEEAPALAAAPRPVVSEIVNATAGKLASYTGTVASRIEIDLGFPMIGTIAERPVDTGDLVRSGQVLARLDPEDLDAAQRAAEAGVAVAAAQLRSARDAEERARALLARGVGSATRVEDAERALAAADARQVQAEAALARAGDMLSLARLEAPQDGVVTQVFAEAGATLSAGQPVLRLAATDEREIVIDLTEADVAALDVGDSFDSVLAANPTISAAATLTRIDPVADRSTRTRRLHLTLDKPPAGFRLGALVRVTPAIRPDAGVAIDIAAVLDPDGTAAVWVADRASDTARLTPVTLGDRFGGQVRITAGLRAGDEVIVKGIHSLQDGQAIGPMVTP
ncbi:MAG: efflux RND transporter periplasmic adaptor subunit [Rhodobacteraceae bacterium]|nr:efflux RND transporter periplasmic adaptor subunit [Paracoccaceae bacterium]